MHVASFGTAAVLLQHLMSGTAYCRPIFLLWNDLLEVLAQGNSSFQAFSHRLHQDCSKYDAPPEDMWYEVLLALDFEDLDV